MKAKFSLIKYTKVNLQKKNPKQTVSLGTFFRSDWFYIEWTPSLHYDWQGMNEKPLTLLQEQHPGYLLVLPKTISSLLAFFKNNNNYIAVIYPIKATLQPSFLELGSVKSRWNFDHQDPSAWNDLPEEVRLRESVTTFKPVLKITAFSFVMHVVVLLIECIHHFQFSSYTYRLCVIFLFESTPWVSCCLSVKLLLPWLTRHLYL